MSAQTGFEKSSSHSLETRYENAIVVHLKDTKQGLGIKIVGGRNLENPQKDFGIYIKDIVPGFLAHKNGNLRIGDQILKANNQNLVGVSNEKAVEILRSCASTDSIELIVARDIIAEAEYKRLSDFVKSGPSGQSDQPQHSNDIKNHQKASSSSSSLSTVSYTSDSSAGHPTTRKDNEGALRPLSAISTSSGPPPPLPTSPPPDEQPYSTLNRQVAPNDILTDRNIIPEHISKSKSASPMVHEEMPSPATKVWTNLSTHSISPASTPTRTQYYSVLTEAPNIYFKSSSSNPKLAEKKLTEDDVTKIAKMEPRMEPSISSVTHRPKQGVSSYQHKRLSVNPTNRFKLEKLIVALKYIGYDLTAQQREELTRTLDIDEQGKVMYEEFVKAAQRIFPIKLDEMQLVQVLREQQKLSLTPKPLPAIIDSSSLDDSINTATSSSYPVDTFILPSLPVSTSHLVENNTEHVTSPKLESQVSQPFIVPSLIPTSTINESTLKQVEELKTLLSQKEREIAETNSENAKLKKELSNFKEHHEHQRRELTKEDLSQKLAVMDCELRKKMATIQRYQVATEQLCRFVEICQDVLVNSASQVVFHPRGKGEYASRGDPIGGNPRPPRYLAEHAKITGKGLAQEAKDTLSRARHILNVEDLPDGWEEQYNKKGEKYYINHKDQKTSWDCPVNKSTDSTK